MHFDDVVINTPHVETSIQHNVALFNSLIKKGKIRKEGASSSTRYLLN